MSNMKNDILKAAVELSEKKGYLNITRNDIADRAGTASGSVTYHFDNMRKLCNAIVDDAIKSRNLVIIAQALMAKHPKAIKLPADLQQQAFRAVQTA